MNSVILAFEWDTKDEFAYTNCISNGARDKESYYKLRETFPSLIDERYPETLSDRASGLKHTKYKCFHMQLDNITEDQQYIYLIPVKNHHSYFFRKFANGFDISDRVYKDVRAGKCTIVFDYAHEGMLGNDSEQLALFNEIVGKLKLPKERLILLHGNFKVEQFEDMNFTYEPVDTFEPWVPIHHISDKIVDYVPEKLFLNYNRRMNTRPHRLMIAAVLIERNLIDDGLVSVGELKSIGEHFTHHMRSLMPQISDDIIEKTYALSNRSWDNSDLTENLAVDLNIDDHRRTFVSLVSETLCDDQVDFLSEKIFKPIAIGHPFILNGSANQLQHIKNLGYKTFDRWWSEEYDTINDRQQRIQCIADLLVEFKSWSIEKLITTRHEMVDVLRHNKQVYMNRLAQQQFVRPTVAIAAKYLGLE